jgi:hypothetical protein
MAGYVIGLSASADVERYCAGGIYGTKLKVPTRGGWLVPHEGTFADFATMRPGDHVYFFSGRKIFGIGLLTRVGPSCAYNNYPGASIPSTQPAIGSMLLDRGDGRATVRWVCTYTPEPHFFRRGVDMDDALAYRPDAFRMLRSFWRRSFIKVDDEEDAALVDLVLRANREFLPTPDADVVFGNDFRAIHAAIARRVDNNYQLDADHIASGARSGQRLRHEMALEASLAFQLTRMDVATTPTFGDWAYITHQLVASPPKPPIYNDWIDLFGYSLIPGTNTIGTFHVAELKKDVATGADVVQLLKYVDWVKDEYCFGDFSLVRAYLVAAEFDKSAFEANEDLGRRFYTTGRHPPITREWGSKRELQLVRYEVDRAGSVRYESIVN